MDRRYFLAAAGVAAVGGTAFYLTQPAGVRNEGLLVGMADAQEAADPSLIPDMVLGDADAPVEVIEYASYTCPHCASFHAGPFKELKENYIDTGKVRFVYREVYFDRFGLWASMVARCGETPEQFFAITEMIYERQREWTASGDPAQIAEELQKIGKIAGLDQETLDACLSDGEFAQNLVTWYEANAEADGIRSTPSFIIDGESYSNMAYADFAAILDEKLAG